MPFPLSYHQVIDLDGHLGKRLLSNESLFLSKMSEELRRAGLQRVFVLGNRISFGGGTPQYLSRRNVFTTLDEGEIEVVSKEERLVISYYLSFRGLLIVASLGVTVVAGLLFLTDFVPLWGALSLMVGGWLLIVGGNYLMLVLEFPSLIESVLNELAADA
jgi:hypothetical protein